jgi:hypothetical protein
MLRRDKLCPSPVFCFEAQQQQPDTELPCEACPTAALDRYLATAMGQRFHAALELDFALRTGFTVTLEDLNCVEFGLLRLLDEERHRLEKQQLDEIRNKRHGR